MGVKWEVLNQQSDDARVARRERERKAEVEDRGAEAQERTKRRFIMLIDQAVAAAQRMRLDEYRMGLVEHWAANLKTRLGLNEGQTVHAALFDVTGESEAIITIPRLQNAIENGERLTGADGNLLVGFQPSYIVGFIERGINRLRSTQRSLRHSSRINGRHARILGVETGRGANGGGYWLN